MCQHPLYIKNKSKTFVPYRNKLYLSVPCGVCDSCRLEQQNGWFIRAYHHFDEYPFAYVYTLTYSDENLPLFTSKVSPEHKDIPCFSHKHVKDFLDCIRTYLLRHHHIYSKDMSFIVASEYGTDEKRTKRPHYHIILYFKKEIDYMYLHDLMRQFWVYKHGFVFPDIDINKKNYKKLYPSKSDIMVRDRSRSAKYVSKYVTKDLEFFEQPKVKEFINDNLKHSDPVLYQKRYFEIKRFLPKHWQSRGFGLRLLDVVNKSKDYYLKGGKFRDLQDNKTYRVPSYIMDKVRYINCLYKLENRCSSCPLVKSIKKVHTFRYNTGLDYDFQLLRIARKLTRKFDVIRYKTNYYTNFLKSHFNDSFSQTKEKIVQWIDSVNSSLFLSTFCNPSKQFNYMFHALSRNNDRQIDKFAYYLTFLRGRHLRIYDTKKTLFDVHKFPCVFTEKFDLDKWRPPRSLVDYLYDRTPALEYSYSSDYAPYTFSDLDQLRGYEELSLNFFNFFSQKSAQLAKNCLDLQKFYKDLKLKRKSYKILSYAYATQKA